MTAELLAAPLPPAVYVLCLAVLLIAVLTTYLLSPGEPSDEDVEALARVVHPDGFADLEEPAERWCWR